MTSLEFVKQRILDGHADLEWTEEEINAAEIVPFTAFMNGKNMPRTFNGKKAEEKPSGGEVAFTTYIDGLKDGGQPRSVVDVDNFPKVSVEYTPDGDFEYFTSKTFESDGTYVFYLNALENLITRIDTGGTYNKDKVTNDFLKNPGLYYVRYKVGDAVMLRRFKTVTNDSGFSFPGEMVSICIPIKWDCEKITDR